MAHPVQLSRYSNSGYVYLRRQSELQLVAFELGRIPEGRGWVLEVDPPREEVAPVGKVEEAVPTM